MDMVGQRDDRLPRSVEWPTLIVAGCLAAGLVSLLFVHDRLPLPITLVLLAVCGAWYGSLQHEVVHGHPTPWARLNVSLVGAPLGLVYPFWLYRADHIEHHATSELTDPDRDPESAYLRTAEWDSAPEFLRVLLRCNRTLLGRLVLGPGFAIVSVGRRLTRQVIDDDRRWITIRFLSADVMVLLGAQLLGLPAWEFALGFGYMGMSLTLVRSFAEHRAGLDGPHTAVVHSRGFWALLFLNNNLHVDHHRHPGEAWYRLPALHRRAARTAGTAGTDTYSGYLEVFRRFLVRPIGPVVYPLERTPAV
jgi:fatty acid desaturase